jgi:hypothetical protein
MLKQIDKEIDDGEIPDPEDEAEKETAPPPPTPVTVVPPQPKPPEEKKKQEKYIPTHEDELTEELTRYMARINEQD